MTDSVLGFFYGGLINPEVQQTVGLKVRRQAVATLANYALTFEPWVNLRRSPGDCVYGLLMEVSHEDLATAYAKLKVRYLPWPVVAWADDGGLHPALCYIAPHMAAGPIDAEHVENLAKPAEALGFPPAYVASIRRFAPQAL